MNNPTENKITLKKLADEALISKIKNLVSIERKLTQVMILHIAELDRRKLYLRMAYSSLYDYLTQEIGYSEGAAQRRIDAARLCQSVPELAQKIESGTIKLSQVSHMQKICRQVKKESGQIVSTQVRQIILEKLENKNSAATQTIVAEALKIEPRQEEILKKSFQADESVRVELTFSKDEFALIEQAQAMLSSKTNGGLKDAFLELVQDFLKNRLPKTDKTNNLMASPDNKDKDLQNSLTLSTATAAVTLKTKKVIHHRDQFCQFKNTSTGKICGSKYFLEVDHIQPRFAAGDNSFENLRLLCRNHNQFRYHAGL